MREDTYESEAEYPMRRSAGPTRSHAAFDPVRATLQIGPGAPRPMEFDDGGVVAVVPRSAASDVSAFPATTFVGNAWAQAAPPQQQQQPKPRTFKCHGECSGSIDVTVTVIGSVGLDSVEQEEIVDDLFVDAKAKAKEEGCKKARKAASEDCPDVRWCECMGECKVYPKYDAEGHPIYEWYVKHFQGFPGSRMGTDATVLTATYEVVFEGLCQI